MTSVPIDQLVSRLNPKRNAFEKALGELRDLLEKDDASKLVTEIKLERLRYQRERLLDTYEPVIRPYEKVVTEDGERKVEELEEACYDENLIKTTMMTLLSDKMPNVMRRQWFREESKVT